MEISSTLCTTAPKWCGPMASRELPRFYCIHPVGYWLHSSAASACADTGWGARRGGVKLSGSRGACSCRVQFQVFNKAELEYKAAQEAPDATPESVAEALARAREKVPLWDDWVIFQCAPDPSGPYSSPRALSDLPSWPLRDPPGAFWPSKPQDASPACHSGPAPAACNPLRCSTSAPYRPLASSRDARSTAPESGRDRMH